jgi:phage terminase large subunit-like protein
VDDYLTEWEHFPLGTNDDQVDATTQALRRMSMPSLDPLPRSGGLIRSDSVDPSVYGF